MASKQKRATRRKANGTAKSKPARKREPPTKMIIHDNSRTPARKPSTPKPQARPRPRPPAVEPEPTRAPIVERVRDMGASHLIAGASAGVVAQAVGVLTVGKGWAGPKTTAGVMIGTGAATTAGGWYFDMDHVMAAGVGVTAAGALSLTNQLAVDAYQGMEKRAAEKRARQEAEKAKKDHESAVAAARKLLAAEGDKHRNAIRIEVIEPDDDDDDDDDDDVSDSDSDDYHAAA